MKNGCFQKWLAVTGFVFILGVCHGRSEVIQSPGPISIYVCDARGTVLPDVYVHVGGRYGTTDANGLAVLDGVPAGAYRLTIEQPAYDRYTEDVVIPSGRRDALKVQLQPSVSVPFVGRISTDESCETPLSGAELSMTPLQVNAVLQGPLTFETDWNGTFAVPPVPAGVYRVEVSASGCKTARFTVNIAPDMPPAHFKLPVPTREVSLRINVRDAQTGAALEGVRLILAEDWPYGVVAERTTDAGGEGLFERLRMGQINACTHSNRVPITRRMLTVRAEKEGYAVAVKPVLVSADAGETTIRLTPEAMQFEQEPNNELAMAQPMNPGAPIRFGISPLHDRDVFQFNLEEPSAVRVMLGADLSNAVETQVIFRDEAGAFVRECGAYAGQDNIMDFRRKAGPCFVEVMEWGNNGTSAERALTLKVSADPAVDPREPNDTPESARPILEGETISGLIWPVGDVDVFKLIAVRPGWIRISEPDAPFERHIILHTQDGGIIRECGSYAKQPNSFDAPLNPGTYYLSIREWGDNDCSAAPYRLRYVFITDDRIDDPPWDTPKAVRMLPLPGLVGASLNPTGDNDVFAIAVPGPGTVRVVGQSSIETHLRLLDITGRMLTERGAYADQRNEVAWNTAGPTTLYLHIMEWGANHWSPAPYVLTAWFEASDELDYSMRNDTFETAVPILSGETVRGTFQPVGDEDVFRVIADFPGYLNVTSHADMEQHLQIYDEQRKMIAEYGAYAGQRALLRPAVGKGVYYVKLMEWGSNQGGLKPYELSATLERAEPAETEPLSADALRTLRKDQAETFSVDHIGDVDRFLFNMPVAGTCMVQVLNPSAEIHVRIFNDQTGVFIREGGVYMKQNLSLPLAANGSTRFRIEVSEWGNNSASLLPQAVMVGDTVTPPALEYVTATNDPSLPAQIYFARSPVSGFSPARMVGVDVNHDGTLDVDVPGQGTGMWDFKKTGHYMVTAILQHENGGVTRESLWVNAVGYHERSGVQVLLEQPAEGTLIEKPVTVSAQAVSYTGENVARVEFLLDGRRVAEDFTLPYEAELPWISLGSGEHILRVMAYDSRGATGIVERTFSLSDYFGLLPEDNATLSGNDVRISWSGSAFGEARVRYRMRGETNWLEQVGENGRARSVLLTNLVAGAAYEFQALGGREPSVLRTVTRVKGLAFGQPYYGANIRRDYDQRIGISVRNHGEQPLNVRLECGQPDDPLLLVGFLGEGSEDKPFELGPGEEREFMLAVSAQDVVKEDQRFSVRITSTNGLADEADVRLHVQLPDVNLKWEELGPAAYGLGQRYRLRNVGDTITDLALYSDKPEEISLSPAIQHGLFAAGTTIECTAWPRLHEGFTGLSGLIKARGLDKEFEQPFNVKLSEGEHLFQVMLLPGGVTAIGDSTADSVLQNARTAAAGVLDPMGVDWACKTDPEDTDGDGLIDRWRIMAEEEDILWVADDTDGNGEVDFVHADVGGDGIFEYSAYKTDRGWEPTNLVEAWLEMGFSLRGPRDLYKEHDVDVVLNGVVVGRLRDVIPDGNYTFRIPPSAMRFDENGRPADNHIGIKSKHLRGGHYVVSSDFRFRMRMTATPLWMVAHHADEAKNLAVQMDGLTVEGPDFSISSAEMKIKDKPILKPGMDVQIEVPLRNLGATSPAAVDVALYRSGQNTQDRVEIGRTSVRKPPVSGMVYVKWPWKAVGGATRLCAVVDPDQKSGDMNRNNNEAVLFVQVSGDTNRPTLSVEEPLDQSVVSDSVVRVRGVALDDSGDVRVEAGADGGLWEELSITNTLFKRDGLFQPGAHTLTVRATDAAGNQTQQIVRITVEALRPEAHLRSPVAGSVVTGRDVRVELECPPEVLLAAAHAEGDPWRKGVMKGQQAFVTVPLRYGSQTLEAMVAGPRGIVQRFTIPIQCTAQPSANDSRNETNAFPTASGLITLTDCGTMDLFNSVNGWLNEVASGNEPDAGTSLDDFGDERPDALLAGKSYLYRNPDTDYRLRATFAQNGVKLDVSNKDGQPLQTVNASLWQVDRSAGLWGGRVDLQDASGLKPFNFSFARKGHMMELIPENYADTEWPSVWIRVRDDDPETFWWE